MLSRLTKMLYSDTYRLTVADIVGLTAADDVAGFKQDCA
jgi:hypothetical protein